MVRVPLADVDGHGDGALFAPDLFGFIGHPLCGLKGEVGHDDMRAPFGGQQNDLAADAAASSHDQHNAPAQLFLRRLTADLGLLQRPVLDAEGFAGRKRDVVLMHGKGRRGSGIARLRKHRRAVVFVHAPRAFHHVNGIQVELAGDTRFGLVLAEAEHANAWNKNHRRVGVAHRGRIGQCMGLVVLRVLGAICFQRLIELRLQLRDIAGRIPIHEQRTNLGTDEVVGATGAQMRQLPRRMRVDKGKHIGCIGEAAQDALFGRHASPDRRHNPDGDLLPLRMRLKLFSAKALSLPAPMLLEELP